MAELRDCQKRIAELEAELESQRRAAQNESKHAGNAIRLATELKARAEKAEAELAQCKRLRTAPDDASGEAVNS